MLYWPLKFGYVTVGMVMGILLTSLWEEQIIGRFRPEQGRFFPSVLRANYLTFGVVMLVLAIKSLPKRMGSPDFLCSRTGETAAESHKPATAGDVNK